VTESATSEAIQILLDDLRAATYPVGSAIEAPLGMAIISFTLVTDSNGVSWRKGVVIDPHSPSAARDAIQAMNEWKRDVSLRHKFAQPSDTMLHTIATFGEDAVREALRPWPLP